MSIAMPQYRLFERIYEITVNGLSVDGMRVGFSIEKTLKKEPNACEVSIYNLAQGTRERLHEAEGLPVVIRAGYRDIGLITIFVGEMREAFSKPEDSGDWITVLRAGDGDKAKQARGKNSFRPGVSVDRALESLTSGMGVGIGNMKAEVKKQFAAKNFSMDGLGQILKSGFNHFGSAQDEASKLVESMGGEMSIQDGQIQVLKAGDVLRPANGKPLWIARLNRSSGLEGTPTLDAKGMMTARARLQPGLNPGQAVQIESAQTGGVRDKKKRAHDVNGMWRIDKTRYIGDTHGQDWNAEIECTEVDLPAGVRL
jgi:hypothetical protein